MTAEEDPLISFRTASPMPREVNMVMRFFSAIAIVVIIIVASECAFVVQPGMIGLVITIGHVTAVNSGLHFKVPLVSELIIMSAKTQKLEEENVTPTKEGLSVKLDTAV
jgi:regulator of protease activity HflC (stomatin/prohibitin superfamily)